MADFGPNPDASLYPQPPVAQPSLLNSNPLGLLQLGSQMAVGRAYQNALSPDGSFNQGTFASGIASSPIAALDAPAAASLRASGIAANTGQFGLMASQNNFLQNIIGGLGPGTPANEARSQLLAAATRANIPPPMTANLLAGMPPEGPAYQQWLGNLRKIALGTANASTMVPGPVTQGGAQTTIPLGSASTSGGYATSLPLGAPESTSMMMGDLASAGNFGQDIFPWRQALTNFQALGPGGTGPGSAGRQQMESYLYALSPTLSKWLPGVDPTKLKNYDELNKYLTQATQQRANGFGANTDMQLATAISGSPNVHINDLAAGDVIKATMALKGMQYSQIQESAKAGGPGYATAKAGWAAQQDPRAYAMAMGLVPPSEIANLQKTLKGVDRDKFNRSLQSAINSGIAVSPPGQQ